MPLDPYRRVLALPGVRSLMVLALLARIPITAIGVTMTLHVAQDLHRGWGAAGLVGAALTVGTALGGPLNGRFVDRRGLRPMLVVTTAAEALFWAFAPFLSFPVLLGGAFVAGVFSLPVFSVIRQSVAALVPADQRRQAYALDSMSVELSFMAGPPLAVLLTSTFSGRTAMWSIGGALVLAGLALYVTNPPVHTTATTTPGDPGRPGAPTAPAAPVRRRDWLTPRFVAVLAAASASTMVLAGTDLGIVAMLRGAGQVGLVGALLAAWAVYSLIGGFVYGALPRALPLAALLGALAVFTVPAGLVGSAWPLLFLTLLPAGALCAPTLTASTDLVSRLVPPAARGEAMGWHGSSLTVGLAIGSPLAGWAIDAGGPSWGFAAVGLVGAAAAGALLFFRHLDTGPSTSASAMPATGGAPAAPPAPASPPAATTPGATPAGATPAGATPAGATSAGGGSTAATSAGGASAGVGALAGSGETGAGASTGAAAPGASAAADSPASDASAEAPTGTAGASSTVTAPGAPSVAAPAVAADAPASDASAQAPTGPAGASVVVAARTGTSIPGPGVAAETPGSAAPAGAPGPASASAGAAAGASFEVTATGGTSVAASAIAAAAGGALPGIPTAAAAKNAHRAGVAGGSPIAARTVPAASTPPNRRCR